MTKRDEQLRSVINLLESHEIDYWADSGTLLGIIRDNELIQSDSDIDIGVWYEDIRDMSEFTRAISSEDYKLTDLWKFSGKPCRYQFRPVDDNLRKVDIAVYFEAKNFAWTPVFREYVTRNPWSFKNPRYWLARLLRFYIRELHKGNVVYDFTKPPWKNIMNVYTFWIPLKFFEDFTVLKEMDIRVPQRFEEYLKYRYDDWEKSVNNWEFLKDDGSIVPVPPEALLEPHEE